METVEDDAAGSAKLPEDRPSASDLPSVAGQKRPRPSRYGMYEDVEEIMYGYGDSWRPSPDSVELMEKMAVLYIRELCARAMQVSNLTGGKIDKECLLFQVRKDRRKFSRAQALLHAHKEIRSAQKLELASVDDTKQS